jgi:hypothetical protein
MDLDSLPPALQAEIKAALAQMNAGGQRDDEAPRGLPSHVTLSALREGVQRHMLTTDSMSLHQRFPAAVAALRSRRLSISGVTVGDTETSSPPTTSPSRKRTARPLEMTTRCNSGIVEVLPCLAFKDAAVVVADSTVEYVAAGSDGSDEPEITLSADWRSLHFASTALPLAEQSIADALGPLTVQSVQLRNLRLFAIDRNTSSRSFVAVHCLPPPPLCSLPGRAEAVFRRTAALLQHTECYARPLLHFAMAELLLRHNGRLAVSRVASRLIRRGELPGMAPFAGAMARGTGVDMRKGSPSTASDHGEKDNCDDADVEGLTLSVPPGTWVVLGMGAGAMAAFLGSSLPACSHVATVEMEPSVVAVNRLHMDYPARSTGMSCVVADAVQLVSGDDESWTRATGINTKMRSDGAVCILLDCYDPVAGDMLCARQLIQGCKRRLGANGVLAVNAHIDALADPSLLAPFVDVFGGSCVHALTVAGYAQVLVICVNEESVAQDPHGGRPRVPPSTLSGLWDYRCVCRIASHGSVTLHVGDDVSATVNRAWVAEGRGAPEPDLMPDPDVVRGGWLDGGLITGSEALVVPISEGNGQTLSRDVVAARTIRKWLVAV